MQFLGIKSTDFQNDAGEGIKIKYGILDYKSSAIKIPVVYEPMKHRTSRHFSSSYILNWSEGYNIHHMHI